ncbi:sclerostin domain-containing protein 1-like [Thrips palmi]|uniref:Sclerostin domain-containing protein 1-like n=1 Tax=Thrips palmi TaxID=161013 RepID=A0A6P8ZT54_THRPL|nr:sclerostin domain-containing protein 1-like [Thrips palmi]
MSVLLVLLLALAVADARDAMDSVPKGSSPSSQGLTGLTGLPAGLSTLIKFRSSLSTAQSTSGKLAPPLSPPAGSPPGLGSSLGGGRLASLDPNQFIKPPVFPEEESFPGSCRLRSKRYVSDGLCVSPRPVNEVVCAVSCVMDAWSKEAGTRSIPWRCSDSGWKRQRVRLLCRDGSSRSYRIRTVQTCRCVPRAAPRTSSARHGPHGPSPSSRATPPPVSKLELL